MEGWSCATPHTAQYPVCGCSGWSVWISWVRILMQWSMHASALPFSPVRGVAPLRAVAPFTPTRGVACGVIQTCSAGPGCPPSFSLLLCSHANTQPPRHSLVLSVGSLLSLG
eukprot:1148217-Pelagomonas_calceolata.AAC.1